MMKRTKHLLTTLFLAIFCMLFMAGAAISASAANAGSEKAGNSDETEKETEKKPENVTKKSGLVKEEDGIYYYKNNKPVRKCWKKVKGKKYYFGKDGKAYIGLKKIGKAKYYFNGSGELQYKTLLKGKKLYRINPLNGKVLKVINKKKKMVCLTFDDGPWGSSTDSVIGTLKSNNVAATFFIIGTNTQYYGYQLKSEYELGCDIANHTYTHLVANGGTAVDTFVNEIEQCNKALKKYKIPKPKYLRAPGGGIDHSGLYTAAIEAAAKKKKMPVFYWSRQSNDCAGASVSAIISNSTSGLSDGEIVLLHDSYTTTAQALPSILSIIKSSGFEPVTLTELALCRKIKYKAGKLYSRYSPGNKKMMKYVPSGRSFYWGT